MTSDLAWQLPGSAPRENIRLWQEGTQLTAYGWFQPPDNLLFDVLHTFPDTQALTEEILQWAEERRRGFADHYPFYIGVNSMEEWREALVRLDEPHPLAGQHLFTSTLASDDQRGQLLEDHGFRQTMHFEPVLYRDLEEIPEPSGQCRFISVLEPDFERRVQLHRDAWAPSSTFDLKRYLQIRDSPLFEPELDIVAVTPDGTFASYTIAWKDAVSTIGSIEPFGTHPDYRGTGLSQEVIHEAFRRLKRRGMSTMRLGTAGFNRQARRLYASCGFEEVDQRRTLIRTLQ